MTKKLITVTLELDGDENGDLPDASEVATALALMLDRSNRAEPAFFLLSEPTVFMEPVAVVVNASGGVVQGATAEIPMQLIAVDYGCDAEDCNRLVPQASSAPEKASIGSEMAEVDAGLIERIRASLNDDDFTISDS